MRDIPQVWMQLHKAALKDPTKKESLMLHAMKYANLVAAEYPDDGYLTVHVVHPALESARNLLNADIGRLDQGILDDELCKIAKECNININDLEG